MQIREQTVVRYGVSVVALALLVGHLVLPDRKIDLLTLGFLVVAVVPWLSSIFESFELPGGWKVKYRDLKLAGDVVVAAASAEKQSTAGADSKSAGGASLVPSPSFDVDDSNLRLVALRIEIERRLRQIALRHAIEKRTLTALLSALTDAGVLERPLHNSLSLIIHAGNQAAHGAQVSAVVGKWAATVGREILAFLDDKLDESKTK